MINVCYIASTPEIVRVAISKNIITLNIGDYQKHIEKGRYKAETIEKVLAEADTLPHQIWNDLRVHLTQSEI